MKDFCEINDLVESVECRMQDAYEQGYETGHKDGEARGIDKMNNLSKEAYTKGLENAWECARKVILSCGEGGYDAGTIKDLFGMSYHDVLKECKPNKVVEIFKEYEQQKQDATDINDGSIKVGDEVYFEDYEDKRVVTNVDDGIICAFSLDSSYAMTCIEKIHKTGRTFPQIAEVLEQLRGEE